MALPSSGPLSLSQVNTELDLTPKSQISLDNAIVRALFERPSGVISMSHGYGKASAFVATITTNQTDLNLRTWALANGWDGTTAASITVGTGVWIYSTSTATPALTTGSFPNGLTIINNGFIAGMGGRGGIAGIGVTNFPGAAGGPAISLGVNVSITNNSYIAGGGGGGGTGTYGGGGGGGAGGGAGGGDSYFQFGVAGGAGGGVGVAGSDGGYLRDPAGWQSSVSGGGGGGRIFPGVGGAQSAGGLFVDNRGRGGGAGGGGGGYWIGEKSNSSYFGGAGGSSNAAGSAGQVDTNGWGGSGGGGWGASGGSGGTGVGGGVAGGGGRAVQLNGFTVTWLANGIRWGAIS